MYWYTSLVPGPFLSLSFTVTVLEAGKRRDTSLVPGPFLSLSFTVTVLEAGKRRDTSLVPGPFLSLSFTVTVLEAGKRRPGKTYHVRVDMGRHDLIVCGHPQCKLGTLPTQQPPILLLQKKAREKAWEQGY